MKLKLNPILLAIAMTGLTACGGSSSDNVISSSDNSNTTTEVIKYKVNVSADESITGQLCVDKNQNLKCDPDETTAELAGGKALLESEDIAVLNNTYTLVNEGQFKLAAPAAIADESTIVLNTATTLIVSNMLQGSSKEQAIENVKQALNTQLGLQLESDKMLSENQAGLENFEIEFNKLLSAAQEKTENTLAVLSGFSIQIEDIAAAISNNTHMEMLDTLVKNSLNWSRGFPMTDTGITYFVSAEQFENEANVAEFPGQDANFGFDATLNDDQDGEAGFTYTKLDETGTELSADATIWSCVKDNQTGLIWETKQLQDGPRSRDTLFVYKADTSLALFEGEVAEASCENGEGTCSVQQYVVHLNSLNDGAGLCGFNDWKVPSFNELYSIVNIGSKAQNESSETLGVDIGYFPNTYAGDYWTDTRSAEAQNYDVTTHYTWAIGFNDSYIGATYSADSCQAADECDYPSALPVRLVSIGEVK